MRSFDPGSAPTLLYTLTRRNGTVEHITQAGRDITLGPLTWTRHPGLKAGVKTSRIDGTPPTMGFWAQCGAAAPLRLRDVARGLYEGARVEIDITSQRNPGLRTFVFDGFMLGDVEVDATGRAFFDLISRFAVPRDIFVEKFTLACRYQFGDWKYCKAPVFPLSIFPDNFPAWLSDPPARDYPEVVGDYKRYRFGSDGTPEDFHNVVFQAVAVSGPSAAVAPTFTDTVGDTIIDGGVTWRVENAWSRAARITAIDDQVITLDRLPDPRAAGNSAHFDPFKFWFHTGPYQNRAFKGAGWNSDTLTGETYLPCPLAAVGDWIEISPDCDKRHVSCVRFGQQRLHGGLPFLPSQKEIAQQLGYP